MGVGERTEFMRSDYCAPSGEVNLYISSDACVKALMSSMRSTFSGKLMTGDTVWSFLWPLVLGYY